MFLLLDNILSSLQRRARILKAAAGTLLAREKSVCGEMTGQGEREKEEDGGRGA